jgi:asparagine synthase (glutamine-hydrolysing)
MAIIINFSNSYRKTIENEHIFLSGNLFVGDTLISGNRLLADLGEIGRTDQLENKLALYNGFFAFVINRDNDLFAAVDRIRSIPLFYGTKNNDFYISNDAEWVRVQVADENMSLMAQQEFLLTGYVTGQDTLFEKVKQLQAGEYLYVKNNAGCLEITTKRYYRFLHKEPAVLPESKLLQEELNGAMNRVIKRLIAYADGRQIVIPLSAGRDSRLIALKLRQFGYQNVLCFSYGIKGNFEAETSKRVAGLLGFPWEYVEYTEELWKKWFNTIDRKEYCTMACNWVSLPHIQDWPAVWKLKKRGILTPQAIFVPGHSGDFPAGSHIPFDAIPETKASMSDLVYATLRKHYSLIVWPRKIKDKKYWNDRIIRNCEVQKINDGYGYVDAFEKWDWQERQAKFVVNSVRVYEFFGFNWWLPFWDNDFMVYWQDIALCYRKNKILYNEYVDTLYVSITGDKCVVEIYDERKNNLRLLLMKLHLHHLGLDLNIYIKRKIGKIPDMGGTNAICGAFSRDFIKKYEGSSNNMNGFWSIFILNELSGNIDCTLESMI